MVPDWTPNPKPGTIDVVLWLGCLTVDPDKNAEVYVEAMNLHVQVYHKVTHQPGQYLPSQLEAID